MLRVMIGIQARSTSTRLPEKIFQKIGDKDMLLHVYDACSNAEKYINRSKEHCLAKTVLLVPTGDKLINLYDGICPIIQGDEFDVLSRFYNAAKEMNSDYIVRITSDCPLLPPYMISKCLNVAIRNGGDYTSNVDPICRTDPDGMDVEVISSKALEWLNIHAQTPFHREHVTTLMREKRPPGYVQLHVVGHYDFSNLKYSVDTLDDLEKVRSHYEDLRTKINRARNVSGPKSVHRI